MIRRKAVFELTNISPKMTKCNFPSFCRKKVSGLKKKVLNNFGWFFGCNLQNSCCRISRVIQRVQEICFVKSENFFPQKLGKNDISSFLGWDIIPKKLDIRGEAEGVKNCHKLSEIIYERSPMSRQPLIREPSASPAQKVQGLKKGGLQQFCSQDFIPSGELRWTMYIWVVSP